MSEESGGSGGNTIGRLLRFVNIEIHNIISDSGGRSGFRQQLSFGAAKRNTIARDRFRKGGKQKH